MGEIKSTLDLVLEKTRNLKLSQEEKQRLRWEEAGKRARGYVQKYLDGVWKFHQLLEALKQDEAPREASGEVLNLLLENIRPGLDWTSVLDELEARYQEKAGPVLSDLRHILSEFEKQVRDLESQVSQRMLRELEELEIRGSAVVPNVKRSPERNRLYAVHEQDTLRALELRKKALYEALSGQFPPP